MATNPYFKEYIGEQTLLDDLVVETIKTMGRDMIYIPREYLNRDIIFGEDPISRFKDAYTIEMYIQNVQSFGGAGYFINKFGINLMRYMRDKYTWLGPSKHSAMIKRLFNNYNPDNIIENAPATDQYTSYVEDKGVVYALCLREKVSGKNEFHDYNILEFVAMHEMAHMASVTAQHDDIEFWINFKILVTNAVEAGLHTPVDYSKEPVNYCRLIVDYNPYFDNTIPSEN